MKYRNIVLVALFGIFVATCPLAAEPRSIPPARHRVAPTTRNVQTSALPDRLAVVNGKVITLADLDLETRAAVEGFDKQMPESRRPDPRIRCVRFLDKTSLPSTQDREGRSHAFLAAQPGTRRVCLQPHG